MPSPEAWFLLLSWGICWYFFFWRFGRGAFEEGRRSTPFAYTAYLVLGLLCAWSVALWAQPALSASAPLFFAGAALTIAGQWLICAARRMLPLSNSDVFFRISPKPHRRGIYRYLAHPMYEGLLLALGGSTLVAGNSAAALLLPLLMAAFFVRALAEKYA